MNKQEPAAAAPTRSRLPLPAPGADTGEARIRDPAGTEVDGSQPVIPRPHSRETPPPGCTVHRGWHGSARTPPPGLWKLFLSRKLPRLLSEVQAHLENLEVGGVRSARLAPQVLGERYQTRVSAQNWGSLNGPSGAPDEVLTHLQGKRPAAGTKEGAALAKGSGSDVREPTRVHGERSPSRCTSKAPPPRT